MKIFEKEPNEAARHRAFTLPELLTILATFVLVVLVVLPALARSSNGSVRAVCFNNLRQMGMAVGMYANDNVDYLAFCNWDGGTANVPGYLYGGNAGGGITDPTRPPYYPNNIAGAYAGGLWFKYINDPKAYLCPLDIQSQTYGFRNNNLCSYQMNGSPNGFLSGQGVTCRITDVWNPGCYLLWELDENAYGPGNPGAFAYNDGAIFPGGGSSEGLPSKLHTLNGTEIVSVGGNVSFVSTNQFRTQSFTAGKSLAWWNPRTTAGH
jgi:hypothetical protein